MFFYNLIRQFHPKIYFSISKNIQLVRSFFFLPVLIVNFQLEEKYQKIHTLIKNSINHSEIFVFLVKWIPIPVIFPYNCTICLFLWVLSLFCVFNLFQHYTSISMSGVWNPGWVQYKIWGLIRVFYILRTTFLNLKIIFLTIQPVYLALNKISKILSAINASSKTTQHFITHYFFTYLLCWHVFGKS